MKNVALAFAALAAVASLTGCTGDTPDDASDITVETTAYRGETIECVKEGSGRGATRSCDFNTFYALHGELLYDEEIGKEDGVTWADFKGHPLACIKEGSGTDVTRSCDFTRYYAAHPDLRPTVEAEKLHDDEHEHDQ